MSNDETYFQLLGKFGDNDGYVEIRSPHGTRVITIARLDEMLVESGLWGDGRGTEEECCAAFARLIDQEVIGSDS